MTPSSCFFPPAPANTGAGLAEPSPSTPINLERGSDDSSEPSFEQLCDQSFDRGRPRAETRRNSPPREEHEHAPTEQRESVDANIETSAVSPVSDQPPTTPVSEASLGELPCEYIAYEEPLKPIVVSQVTVVPVAGLPVAQPTPVNQPDDVDAPVPATTAATLTNSAALNVVTPIASVAPIVAPTSPTLSMLPAAPASEGGEVAQSPSTPNGESQPQVASGNAVAVPTAPFAATSPATMPQKAAVAETATEPSSAANTPPSTSAAATDATEQSPVTAENTPLAERPTVGARLAEREKTAGSHAPRIGAVESVAQKNFLNAASEEVAADSTSGGTGTAISADMTKSAPFSSPRLHAHSALRAGIAATGGGETAGTSDLSHSWKGWTNGGGERVSTAAQFSRLGEHSPSAHAPFFSAPGFPAARTQSQATQAPAPVQQAFPANEAALLAPIGTAIERLVARGQDQLAITVRFEQGGSLSLKLALRSGEIATQIQTDVPGLEAALRSSWNQLAQDWQTRGLKLASPEFSGGTSTSQHQQHDLQQHDRGSSGRDQAFANGEGAAFSRGTFSVANATRRGASSSSPAVSPNHSSTASTDRRGLQTWA